MSEHQALIVENLERLLGLAKEGRIRGVGFVSLTDVTVEWHAICTEGGVLSRMEMCKGLSLLEEELTDQIYEVATGEETPMPMGNVVTPTVQ